MVDFHYTSALILFCSSVTGCLLPFQRKFDVKPIRPLSTGIVFAVALCHLLPDSSQILDTIQVTEWFMAFTRIQGNVGDDGLYEVLPVTETLVCLGVFIMIVIDQCIPCPHHLLPTSTPPRSPSSGEKALLLPAVSPSSGNGTPCSHNGNGAITNGNGKHNGDHYQYNSFRKGQIPNAKVYATEVAIAIHSIIIGFTMGVNPNTDSLVGLTIAMTFHQMFEGVALAMIAQQGDLGFRALLFMVVMFASSLPLGINIGLYAYKLAMASESPTIGSDEEIDVGAIVFQGIPNAISSGMLLHIGFELMMEDFHHKSSDFPASKLILVFIGGFAMCFLTFWA